MRSNSGSDPASGPKCSIEQFPRTRPSEFGFGSDQLLSATGNSSNPSLKRERMNPAVHLISKIASSARFDTRESQSQASTGYYWASSSSAIRRNGRSRYLLLGSKRAPSNQDSGLIVPGSKSSAGSCPREAQQQHRLLPNASQIAASSLENCMVPCQGTCSQDRSMGTSALRADLGVENVKECSRESRRNRLAAYHRRIQRRASRDHGTRAVPSAAEDIPAAPDRLEFQLLFFQMARAFPSSGMASRANTGSGLLPALLPPNRERNLSRKYSRYFVSYSSSQDAADAAVDPPARIYPTLTVVQ
eukprot:3767969-Rhodomonas_salina.2